MKTTDKTVLITGGGSGIGNGIARALAADGSRVIVTGRTLTRLEQAKRETPALEIVQSDISDTAQVEALVKYCDETFDGIDVLINNAGMYQEFQIHEDALPVEEQLLEINLNLGGPIRMVHHFLPGLLAKPEAAIVNVSSVLAFVPYSPGPVYSASKAALHSWTLSLRKHLKGTSVKVIELMPPLVDTEMVADVDLPKISVEKLTDGFMKGLRASKVEITPGQAGQLKFLSRVAPRFIFKQLNK